VLKRTIGNGRFAIQNDRNTFFYLPLRHRNKNPKGNNGSIRQSRRAGEGTKSTTIGAYAMKIPVGIRIPSSMHFMAVPRFKFAPAESPATAQKRVKNIERTKTNPMVLIQALLPKSYG